MRRNARKLTSEQQNTKHAKQLDHGPSIQVVLRHLAETQGKPRDSLDGNTGQLRQLLMKQLEQVRVRSMRNEVRRRGASARPFEFNMRRTLT